MEKRILRLRIQNIPPYKFVDRSFENKGLVRLQGPNGVGKSTLFNMMTNLLTGDAPIKRDKSDFAEDKKTSYLLEVTWSYGGKTYVGAYSQKSELLNPAGEEYGTGVFLFEDNILISGHDSRKAVKLIHQYFGASIEDWFATGYIAQAMSHGLINGTPAQRMSHFSSIFGLEKFDRLAAFFNEKASALELKVKELEDIKRKIEINQSLLAAHPSLEEIQEKRTSLLSQIQDIENALSELRTSQERYKKLQEVQGHIYLTNPEVKKDSFDAAQLLQKLTTLEQEYIEGMTQLKLAEEVKFRLSQLPKLQKLELPENYEMFLNASDINLTEAEIKKAQLTSLKASLVEVNEPYIPADMEQVLAYPDIDVIKIKQLITQIKSRPAAPSVPNPTMEGIQELQSELTKLQAGIASKEVRLKQLSLGKGVCDTCGTELNCTDREEEKLKLEQELLQEKSAALNVSQQVTSAYGNMKLWQGYLALGPDRSNEIPDLEKQVELFNLKQEYKQLQFLQQQYEKYIATKKAVEELPTLEAQIYQYKMKKYVQDIQKMNVAYEANEQTKAQLERQLNSIVVVDLSGHQREVVQIKNLIEERDKYNNLLLLQASLIDAKDYSEDILKKDQERVEVSQQLGYFESEESVVKNTLKTIQDLVEQALGLENVNREYVRYSTLAKAYGKSGVLRKAQISRFNTFLSNALLPYTHKLLPHLKFSFNIDEGVLFMAEKPGVPPYDVKTCSGGEKGCLSLALVFALDDIAPAHKKFNLKVIDEIEAFMDKDRKEDFLQLIIPELRKRAETLILISHTPSANAIDFDEVWEVTTKGTVETVSEQREFV